MNQSTIFRPEMGLPTMKPQEAADIIDADAELTAAEELEDSGLIMLEYNGFPTVYKDASESITKRDYRITGITYNRTVTDGDETVTGVNIWLRPYY